MDLLIKTVRFIKRQQSFSFEISDVWWVDGWWVDCWWVDGWSTSTNLKFLHAKVAVINVILESFERHSQNYSSLMNILLEYVDENSV